MTNTLKNPDSIDDYAQLCSYASTYAQGWVQRKPGSFENPVVTTVRSSRGIDEDRARVSLDIMWCNNANAFTKLSSQSLDVAKPIVFDISPSGTIRANLHNTFYGSSGSKEEKFIIEIVNDESESFRIDASNVHGAFMGDSWFGGSSWSADDKYFAYVAVVKVEKPQTFFGSQAFASGSSAAAIATAASSKYSYTEDWGERFGGIGALGLFVLDLAARRIHKIGDIDMKQWTVGQPCIVTTTPQSDGRSQYLLGYTAFSQLPRKLGLFSCFQRPHSLFICDITALLQTEPSCTEALKLSHFQLSSGLKTARSLRCSPDGAVLAFLGQEKGFEEHSGCSELFTATVSHVCVALASSSFSSTRSSDNTSSAVYRKVVAQVDTPQVYPASREGYGAQLGFPGLYCEALPARCFTTTSKVVLASQWGSDTVVLTADLATGAVEKLATGPGTAAVLDVAENLVLYAQSTPTSPARLHVYDTAAQGNAWSMGAPAEQAVRLLRASSSGVPENLHPDPAQRTDSGCLKLVAGEVPTLSWRVFSHCADSVPFESILIYPSSRHPAPDRKRGVPVVLVPHGGPHSCMSTAYFHAYVFLAHQLGAAVLHVNYRGSPGFGQASIHSLPGNIGTNDVADMMTALHHAFSLRYDPASGAVLEGEFEAEAEAEAEGALPLLIDPQRVSVVGGSHGGFLAGHLIGQHPEVFKAAAMRNPVTNIPAMYSVSDIPDWCVVESCGSGVYDFGTYAAASEEVLLTMRRCSPVHHVQRVRAPTLVCLGGRDRRVPPSQGLEYHHLLRAQGVETRLMVFPEDNHPIDKPASEAEHWVAIADWIATHV